MFENTFVCLFVFARVVDRDARARARERKKFLQAARKAQASFPVAMAMFRARLSLLENPRDNRGVACLHCKVLSLYIRYNLKWQQR